jgi:hypothetical protein
VMTVLAHLRAVEVAGRTLVMAGNAIAFLLYIQISMDFLISALKWYWH